MDAHACREAGKEFRDLFRTYLFLSKLISGLMRFRQSPNSQRLGHFVEAGHGTDDGGVELFRSHRCVVADQDN